MESIYLKTYKREGSFKRAALALNISEKSLKKELLRSGERTFGLDSLNMTEVRAYSSEHGLLKAAKYFNVNLDLFLVWCEMHNVKGLHRRSLLEDVGGKERYISLITTSRSFSELCEKEPMFSNYSPKQLSSQNAYFGIVFGGFHEPTAKELLVKECIILNQNESYAEIGKRFDISAKTVSRIATKFGIDRKGLNNPKAYSTEFLLNQAKICLEKFGYVSSDLLNKSSGISESTFLGRFGSFQSLRKLLGISEKPISIQDVFLNIFEDASGIPLIREYNFKNFDEGYPAYRLDGFNAEFSLGVEYDTPEHFIESSLFGGPDGLIERQFRDSDKNRICEAENIKLLRFRFEDDWSRDSILERIKTAYDIVSAE